jgi:hypothetical protein
LSVAGSLGPNRHLNTMGSIANERESDGTSSVDETFRSSPNLACMDKVMISMILAGLIVLVVTLLGRLPI